MPYRLRIKFPGGQIQAPRILQAERGLYNVTGRPATLSRYTPVVADDEWAPLFTSATIGASPSMANAWVAGCVVDGEWFFPHQQVASSTGGPWLFNLGTSTWRRTNTNTTDWWRGIAFRENYDVAYDPDRNAVWVSTGGPVGWTGAPGSPVYGALRYDIASDTFTNVYPQSDSTYVPSPTDAAYFLSANKGLGPSGFDHKWLYANGYLYTLGGWQIGSNQGLRRYDFTTNTQTTLSAYGAGLPPMNKDDGRYTVNRARHDSRQNRIYLFADDGAMYTYDLVPSALTRSWQLHTPTGSGPATAVGDPVGGNTAGVVYAIDENANCIVAWAGSGDVLASPGASYRRTWVLDMATLQWRSGPSNANGDIVPGAGSSVEMSADYDAVSKQVLLAYSPRGTFTTQIWAFRGGSTQIGKITSFRLPTMSGTVYGVNYYGFPFAETGECKHVNMAYCPLNDRLYATGGDSISSAVDGIWSMSLADGSWRLDAGKPIYPSFPAPSAYQDNEGFEWSPTRGKFIFWPGSGTFGYGGNVFQYGEGLWFFDPTTNVWTQDTRLFTGVAWTTAQQIDFALTMSNTTGMIHGGIYDAQTDTIYASTSTSGMKRYSMATVTQIANAPLTGYPGTPLVGYPGVYWSETKWAQIGRWIYMPTALYNGNNGYFALAKWNIDNGAFVWCALPPMPQFSGTGTFKEQRIGASRNKIVWPKTTGPDGVIYGIYVYDTDTDTWEVDTQVPGYGVFRCNAVASIPDGRVVMAGSSITGKIHTHIWFYEAL